jgi:hypothetical protein
VRSPKWRATGRQHPGTACQPVINVPPPTVIVQQVPPAASAPRKAGWARTWSVAKVAGPSAASLAALVISLLAYNDQHRADSLQAQAQKAADAAALRHDAELVSWSLDAAGDVVIVNASTSLITGVLISNGYTITKKANGKYDVEPGITNSLAELRSCSMVTVFAQGQSPLAKADLKSGGVVSIFFTDRYGKVWMLSSTGSLRPPDWGDRLSLSEYRKEGEEQPVPYNLGSFSQIPSEFLSTGSSPTCA